MAEITRDRASPDGVWVRRITTRPESVSILLTRPSCIPVLNEVLRKIAWSPDYSSAGQGLAWWGGVHEMGVLQLTIRSYLQVNALVDLQFLFMEGATMVNYQN